MPRLIVFSSFLAAALTLLPSMHVRAEEPARKSFQALVEELNLALENEKLSAQNEQAAAQEAAEEAAKPAPPKPKFWDHVKRPLSDAGTWIHKSLNGELDDDSAPTAPPTERQKEARLEVVTFHKQALEIVQELDQSLSRDTDEISQLIKARKTEEARSRLSEAQGKAAQIPAELVPASLNQVFSALALCIENAESQSSTFASNEIRRQQDAESASQTVQSLHESKRTYSELSTRFQKLTQDLNARTQERDDYKNKSEAYWNDWIVVQEMLTKADSENATLHNKIDQLAADLEQKNRALLAQQQQHDEDLKKQELTQAALVEAQGKIETLNGTTAGLNKKIQGDTADYQTLDQKYKKLKSTSWWTRTFSWDSTTD